MAKQLPKPYNRLVPVSHYYGGSVAMLDFQRHLPWLAALEFITLAGITHSRPSGAPI
jgi:hypothetical protein